jgi:NTE family protein
MSMAASLRQRHIRTGVHALTPEVRHLTVQFRNLVFEGGGVKGIACIGAMQVLERRGQLADIERAGGASAGAINALLFALGYDTAAQLELLWSVDFRDFMDNAFGGGRRRRFPLHSLATARGAWRLVRTFGWHPGDFLSGWIGDVIADRLGRPDATFGDLRAAQRPALHVIGTNLSTGFAEVFSAERHADMPLAQAVRISMSIPILFSAVRHGPRGDVFVDGGVQLNYPVKLFDRRKYIRENELYAARTTDYYEQENARFEAERPNRSPYVYNRQTLGMRLDTREAIALFRYDEPLRGREIRRLPDYARALLTGLMNAQESTHLHSDDWQRTLYIDTLDVGTTDFHLSDARKTALLAQGALGAETYFRWFDDPLAQPANRIPADAVPQRAG